MGSDAANGRFVSSLIVRVSMDRIDRSKPAGPLPQGMLSHGGYLLLFGAGRRDCWQLVSGDLRGGAYAE
jgi:hypothetical protein